MILPFVRKVKISLSLVDVPKMKPFSPFMLLYSKKHCHVCNCSFAFFYLLKCDKYAFLHIPVLSLSPAATGAGTYVMVGVRHSEVPSFRLSIFGL